MHHKSLNIGGKCWKPWQLMEQNTAEKFIPPYMSMIVCEQCVIMELLVIRHLSPGTVCDCLLVRLNKKLRENVGIVEISTSLVCDLVNARNENLRSFLSIFYLVQDRGLFNQHQAMLASEGGLWDYTALMVCFRTTVKH